MAYRIGLHQAGSARGDSGLVARDRVGVRPRPARSRRATPTPAAWRRARVLRTERLSARMGRVTLGGAELRGLADRATSRQSSVRALLPTPDQGRGCVHPMDPATSSSCRTAGRTDDSNLDAPTPRPRTGLELRCRRRDPRWRGQRPTGPRRCAPRDPAGVSGPARGSQHRPRQRNLSPRR